MKNRIKCEIHFLCISKKENSISITGKTYGRNLEAIYYPNENTVLVELLPSPNIEDLIFRSFITFNFNKKEFNLNLDLNDEYIKNFNITKDEEFLKFNSEFNAKKLERELKTKEDTKTKKLKI